jgi:hypothetical protein
MLNEFPGWFGSEMSQVCKNNHSLKNTKLINF